MTVSTRWDERPHRTVLLAVMLADLCQAVGVALASDGHHAIVDGRVMHIPEIKSEMAFRGIDDPSAIDDQMEVLVCVNGERPIDDVRRSLGAMFNPLEWEVMAVGRGVAARVRAVFLLPPSPRPGGWPTNDVGLPRTFSLEVMVQAQLA
jgi:hypothetical protein